MGDFIRLEASMEIVCKGILDSVWRRLPDSAKWTRISLRPRLARDLYSVPQGNKQVVQYKLEIQLIYVCPRKLPANEVFIEGKYVLL